MICCRIKKPHIAFYLFPILPRRIYIFNLCFAYSLNFLSCCKKCMSVALFNKL